MAFYAKPFNLGWSAVKTSPDATMVSFSNDALNLTSIAYTPFIADIRSVTRTAYAAGTLKVLTITFGGTAWDTTKAYQINIIPEDTSLYPVEQYTFFPTAATSSGAGAGFRAAVQAASTTSIVTCTGATTDAILTQNSLYSGNFQYQVIVGDGVAADVTAVETTPYVRPSGTVTEVALYDSTVSSGTYDKWAIECYVPTSVNQEGKIQGVNQQIVYWVNTAGGSYAAFHTAMNGWFGRIMQSKQRVDVTQATSITTGVTANGTYGVITTVAATNASVTPSVFILTNSKITSSSIVKVGISGGTWTAGAPTIAAQASGSGSVSLTLSNSGTAALNGTVKIWYEVAS